MHSSVYMYVHYRYTDLAGFQQGQMLRHDSLSVLLHKPHTVVRHYTSVVMDVEGGRVKAGLREVSPTTPFWEVHFTQLTQQDSIISTRKLQG